MPNAWIDHVRAYAREHNISYGCAVSEARASYVRAPGKARAAKPPGTGKNYRKKVTPEQRERAKVVKQRILDKITY